MVWRMVLLMSVFMLVEGPLAWARVEYQIKNIVHDVQMEAPVWDDVLVTDDILMSQPQDVSDMKNLEVMISDESSIERQPLVEDSKNIADVIENSRWEIAFQTDPLDDEDVSLRDDPTDYEALIEKHKWEFESKALAEYYKRNER